LLKTKVVGKVHEKRKKVSAEEKEKENPTKENQGLSKPLISPFLSRESAAGARPL
jgi:hypothetical protein